MLLTLLLLSLLSVCASTSFNFKPLSDEEIHYINSVQSSWRAGRNFYSEDLERVRGLLGVDIEGEKRFLQQHPVPKNNVVIREDLPKEFDPLKKWPHCNKSLTEIRDQSACGSCWAFGPAEAMTDRICIHTKTPVHISAEDINSCFKRRANGCGGGFTAGSWAFYRDYGVVSGGNYNSSQGCMPYSLPNCDHHTKGKYKPCGDDYPTPPCHHKCRKGYPKTYTQDKHFGQEFTVQENEKEMMQELFDNGPISATFNVYSDFMSYKSGIYKHVTGEFLGGHAIKILGYGEENGEKYWHIANSWNEDWGEKGYFRMIRGTNDCHIEGNGIAALPKV